MSSLYDDDEQLFRSHFRHANHLEDRAYEHVQPAYQLGRSAGADCFNEGCGFEEIEKDLENHWLNVRVAHSEWASVREFAMVGFDRARQGSVTNAPPAGTADIPPYADPLGPNESRL